MSESSWSGHAMLIASDLSRSVLKLQSPVSGGLRFEMFGRPPESMVNVKLPHR